MEGMMGPPGPHMETMMPPGGQFQPGQFPPWVQAGMTGVKAKKRGRKKKKLNQNANMTMNSVLDRTSPCPNVDVRHMHPPPLHHPGGPNPQLSPLSGGAVPPHQGMNPSQHGQQGMYPSFLENPTSFLAQQAAFVSNSLNTSQQQHDLDLSMSSTTSSQQGDQSSNQGDTSNLHGDNSLSSAHSSPASSRQSYTPGKSPPLAGKSPPVSMGQYPSTASPHVSLPSPTCKSTPSQSTPRSRRSSQGSHTSPSPSVTPRPGLPLISPSGAQNDSVGLHDSSSSSTATATSGDSLLESPTSTPHVPPSGQSGKLSPAGSKPSQDVLNRIKTEPGLTLPNPGLPKNPNLPNPPGIGVKKTGKSGKNKAIGGAKAKQAAQNQMNLNSFSNALEFQQILANKYGPGSFPASSLLTAAAKAQSNNPNPLAQAISQLQQAFQGNANTKGMKNNGLVPGCSSNNSANSQDQAGNPKKDDFHASSFLVGEGGRLDGGEAMAALLSQVGLGNLGNPHAAQLMLQQLSGFQQQQLTAGEGEAGTGPSTDPEQLAASQIAMINMAAAGLAAANGNTQAGAGNTGAAPGGSSGMITGLEATENAIMRAFNSEDPIQNAPTTDNVPRTVRRRSAPGQQDDAGPGGKRPCPSRPSSAPGGQAAIQAGLTTTSGMHSSSHPQIAHMLQRGIVSMTTNTNTATSPIVTNTTQGLPSNKTSSATSGPIISQAAITSVTSSLSQSIPSISITPGTSLSHTPGASLSQPGALSPMSANSNEPITVTLEATGEQVTIPPLSEILLATPEQLSRLSPQQLAAMQQLIQQQLQLHSQNMQNMQQQSQQGQVQQASVPPQQTITPGQQGNSSVPPSEVVQAPGMGTVMFQNPMPPFQQPGAVTMQQMNEMGVGTLAQGQQIVGLNMDAMTQLQLNPLCIPMPPQSHSVPQSQEQRSTKQASPRKSRVSPKKYGQKKTADGRPVSVDGRIISNISSIEESINAVVNQSYEEEDAGQSHSQKTQENQDTSAQESPPDNVTSQPGN